MEDALYSYRVDVDDDLKWWNLPRVALVERDISFTPDMSVRQTLLFHRCPDYNAADDDNGAGAQLQW